VAFLSQLREEPYHSQVLARQVTAAMEEQAYRRGFFVWSSADMLGTRLDIVLLARYPATFLARREGESARLLRRVLRWAAQRGYTDVGLGSLVASVSSGGRELLPLADELGLRLDHGLDMSCALAWRQACALEACGMDLSRSTVAVVGGMSALGAGVARMIARQVRRLILVVRRHAGHAQRMAEALRRSALGLEVEVATDYRPLRQADLVCLAHGSLARPIRSAHLQPGAVVLDACAPAAVRAQGFAPGRHLVLPAGCGVLPRSCAPRGVGVDLGLGNTSSGPIVYGCMLGAALGAGEAFQGHRLGPVDEAHALEILRQGEQLAVRHQPFEMCGERLWPEAVRSFLRGGWELPAQAS